MNSKIFLVVGLVFCSNKGGVVYVESGTRHSNDGTRNERG